MDSILVTGCAGFIGSQVAGALLDKGYPVLGVDSLNDYYSLRQKEENLKALQRKGFCFIRGDLNALDLAPLLQSVKGVMHLAAQAGVRLSWDQFDRYVSDNILATHRLLAASAKAGVRKFVYSSSSSVYGSCPLPFTEDALPSPSSPYGVTKLAAEHLCRSYAPSFPVVCLRYFTVYGPRQRPDMAFHLFIRALLEGRPLEVFGDGTQSRDFTYVSDVVDANLLALEGKATGVFNIASGTTVTLREAVTLLEELTGKKARLSEQAPGQGEMPHTEASLKRAREALGYRPSVPLREGLEKEIKWLKAFYGH